MNFPSCFLGLKVGSLLRKPKVRPSFSTKWAATQTTNPTPTGRVKDTMKPARAARGRAQKFRLSKAKTKRRAIQRNKDSE